MGITIKGACQPGFETVRDAFARCFDELDEVGAATCVYIDGKPVVDLWAGVANPDEDRAWQEDTIVHVYSVTKAFAAVCLLRLIDDGAIELDAPVARYWPEFAQAGKADVPVRWLLTHQAGVLGIREPLPAEAIFDSQRIATALAEEKPWWPPGEKVGEHAYFFGNLVGELVRRVDGRTLGTYLRDEVTGPWNLDFHVGLKPSEEARCAQVVGIDAAWLESLQDEPSEIYDQALGNPSGLLDGAVINSPAWRQAEIPAVNGHGTARAIARFYGLLSRAAIDSNKDEPSMLSPSIVRDATKLHASGDDVLLQCKTQWGLGFQIDDDGFGFGGLGGALGWGNIDHRFGFGFVTNHMADHSRAMLVLKRSVVSSVSKSQPTISRGLMFPRCINARRHSPESLPMLRPGC